MADADKALIEAAKEYLDKVVAGPLVAVGGIIEDQVNYWRFKNRITLLLKAKRFLEDKGIDPQKVLPSVIVPILEDGSTTDDDLLTDMFARLLAAQLDAANHRMVHPSYSKVLLQLAPIDAQILSAAYNELHETGAIVKSRVRLVDQAAAC